MSNTYRPTNRLCRRATGLGFSLTGLVTAALMVSAMHALAGGATLKVTKEIRYPTSYEVTGLTGIRTGPGGGLSSTVGAVVEPSNFETREVGVVMSVEATVGDLSAWNNTMATLEQEQMYGNTPLIVAAATGNESEVRRLLARRSAVNTKNRNGATALFGAAAGGFDGIVRMLIDRGAQVNLRSRDGSSPLMFAARNGHTKVVETLLAAGAAVNQADENGRTPLMLAVFDGHADVVNRLTAAGANVNVHDRNGSTPLKLASAREHNDMVVLLTRLGARQ